MTVSDSLPFIESLSRFRKRVGEHNKPLKVAQSKFLTVSECTGGRGIPIDKHDVEMLWKAANAQVFWKHSSI